MLDEFRSTYITWDKATRRIYSPITANESDSNGRKLNIQVVNSGQVENLTGATLHLYWETKDKAQHGLDAFTASDITKGEFEIFYTTGMLSNVGELNATLVLVDGTGKVISDWFKITVARGINESAIQSENSFSSLTQALIDISNLEQNYTPRLNDLTTQLAQKAGLDYVDAKTQANNLAWKESFATLAALQTKYPTGDTFNHAVLETGEVYRIYTWIDGNWINTNVQANGTGIAENSINEKMVDASSDIVLKRIGKNLYNFATDTLGAYVDYRNGNIVSNPDLRASDYIELPANSTVTISNQSPKPNAGGNVGDLSQFARFKEDKTFLQGYAMSGLQKSHTFTTGADKEYVRITTDNLIKDGMQVELNSTYTTYEPYEKVIPSESVLSNELRRNVGLKTILTVKKDGTGTYTNLRQALDASSGSSVNNRYEIQIHEGTYNVLSDYSTVEINTAGFIGPIKQPFVDIIGVGNRNKIILVGTLPYVNTIYPASSKQMISTLNLFGEGRLENVTVTADNIRYAVHDDWEYLNMKRIVKKCRFVHYKGGETHFGGKQAWGAGSFSGQYFEFEDCVFESDWDYYAFTSHNNRNFTSPSHHKFVNCDFITTTNLQGLRFESLGSGQIDTVDLLNCRYNGIHLSTITAMTNHIDHYIKGAGNTIAPVTFSAQDDYQYTYDLAGETIKRYNLTSATIPKGTPVRFGSGGQTVMPLGTFDPVFYVGIAMEDISNQSNGLIRIAGYLPISDTGLTLSLGDKVGLLNGALTKVTTGDYIGYVQVNGFVKLVS